MFGYVWIWFFHFGEVLPCTFCSNAIDCVNRSPAKGKVSRNASSVLLRCWMVWCPRDHNVTTRAFRTWPLKSCRLPKNSPTWKKPSSSSSSNWLSKRYKKHQEAACWFQIYLRYARYSCQAQACGGGTCIDTGTNPSEPIATQRPPIHVLDGTSSKTIGNDKPRSWDWECFQLPRGSAIDSGVRGLDKSPKLCKAPVLLDLRS